MEGKKILFIFFMIISFLVIIYIINYTTAIIKNSQISTENYDKSLNCLGTKIKIDSKLVKYNDQGALSVLIENSGKNQINTLFVQIGNSTLSYNTSFDQGDYFNLVIPDIVFYINNSNSTDKKIILYPNECEGSKIILDLTGLIG